MRRKRCQLVPLEILPEAIAAAKLNYDTFNMIR
jgi:hypothetical protein